VRDTSKINYSDDAIRGMTNSADDQEAKPQLMITRLTVGKPNELYPPFLFDPWPLCAQSRIMFPV
jgi:hypothetical protein